MLPFAVCFVSSSGYFYASPFPLAGSEHHYEFAQLEPTTWSLQSIVAIADKGDAIGGSILVSDASIQ